MQIITTINDLKNTVDGWISERIGANDAEHRAAIEKIARNISARAQKAGLSYGQDWERFLRDIDSEELYEMAN